jgi:ABC-type sugar transport system permease subunit
MAISTAPAVATVKPSSGSSRADRVLGVVMLMPALTYIALLVALPFLLAVFLSLTNSSAGSLEFSWLFAKFEASV